MMRIKLTFKVSIRGRDWVCAMFRGSFNVNTKFRFTNRFRVTGKFNFFFGFMIIVRFRAMVNICSSVNAYCSDRVRD